MIFESHAHYDDEAFDEDREELLGSMKAQGIDYIINVSANIRTVKNTIGLMNRYPFVYGAIGIHPDEVEELNEEKFSWMKEQCALPKVVAVGETGLDYYWDKADHATQKHWFERQLSLAKEVNLPVIVHSRDAAKDTLDVMKAMKAEEITGVIHCFSYGKEMAKEYLDMGYAIGIGGVVTFKNAKKMKEVAEYVPLESILLETDAPYLAPEPYRGKRNSSLNLPYIAQAIADIKGITLEEVIAVTSANAKELYFHNKDTGNAII